MIGTQLALRRQLFRGESAQMRRRLLGNDLGCAGRPRELVLRFDQQPWIAALALARADAHQVPASLEALAMKRDVEMPFLEPEFRVKGRLPVAPIPDDHRPATVGLIHYSKDGHCRRRRVHSLPDRR